MFQKIKDSILSIPFFYNFVQWMFGSGDGRRNILTTLEIQKDDVVLDIGCGTSILLEFFPNCSYYGYDLSEDYIKKAKKKYRDRPNTSFYCEAVSLMNLPKEVEGSCDKVLAIGVVHHLKDSEVQDLFDLAAKALRHGGKLITIDPTFIDNQNIIAKALVGADRGEYVRHIDTYKSLYTSFFKGTFTVSVKNFNRFPYNHAVIVGTKA